VWYNRRTDKAEIKEFVRSKDLRDSIERNENTTSRISTGSFGRKVGGFCGSSLDSVDVQFVVGAWRILFVV